MSAIDDLKDAAQSVVNKQEKVQSGLLSFEIDILHDALNLVYLEHKEGSLKRAETKFIEAAQTLDNNVAHISYLVDKISDLQTQCEKLEKHIEDRETDLEAVCIVANNCFAHETQRSNFDERQRACDSQNALREMLFRLVDKYKKL